MQYAICDRKIININGLKEILNTEIMATIIDGHIAYKHKDF